MLRFLLLALGLSMSLMTVRNSASMSRSYNNNDSSVAPMNSHQPSTDDSGRPHGAGRSGYIVASS